MVLGVRLGLDRTMVLGLGLGLDRTMLLGFKLVPQPNVRSNNMPLGCSLFYRCYRETVCISEGAGQNTAANNGDTDGNETGGAGTVCVSERKLHLRMPLSFTPLLRLKRC
jgi:hypothetical protein